MGKIRVLAVIVILMLTFGCASMGSKAATIYDGVVTGTVSVGDGLKQSCSAGAISKADCDNIKIVYNKAMTVLRETGEALKIAVKTENQLKETQKLFNEAITDIEKNKLQADISKYTTELQSQLVIYQKLFTEASDLIKQFEDLAVKKGGR